MHRNVGYVTGVFCAQWTVLCAKCSIFYWVNLSECLGLARKRLALGVHDSSFVMFIYINVERELIETRVLQ